jgi:ribosomal protein S18 acetylase RimI-like enzyme
VITIREAHEADYEAIWPIIRDVFAQGETYAVDPRISKEAARSYWMGQAVRTYVAVTDAGIVGTYYIKTNQPGGGAHICNCGYVVDPSAQGQGVARQMCEHSQKAARALGYRAMQFNFVLASNAGAIRLWHRLGFEIIGNIPDAFDHPRLGMVDAYVMYKRL